MKFYFSYLEIFWIPDIDIDVQPTVLLGDVTSGSTESIQAHVFILISRRNEN